MILEFNNNNIWEVEYQQDNAGEFIICRNRKGSYDGVKKIKEDQLVTSAFNFDDWKTFYIQPRATSQKLRDNEFPMAYYAINVLGYPIIEKAYDTKIIFRKYPLETI